MNVSPFIEAENARDADVPSTQVAEWAGHSVAVLHRIYAKILAGRRRVPGSALSGR